jgi:hypothetical protein
VSESSRMVAILCMECIILLHLFSAVFVGKHIFIELIVLGALASYLGDLTFRPEMEYPD